MDGKFSGDAVIAGGSIAGLLVARILSDHFDTVTIVETDPAPDERRPRVPQWDHIHVFLAILLRILRRLFPCFDKEATRFGLHVGVATYNLQLEGKTIRVDESQLDRSLGGSRQELERLLRKLVRQNCPNIRFMQGSVVGLVPSPDRSLVAANVRFCEGSKVQRTPLSFFADCTGPARLGSKWLARADPAWAGIGKDVYDPVVSYQSLTTPAAPPLTSQFLFPRPWEDYGHVFSANSSEKSRFRHGYSMGHLEHDRLIVTCISLGHPTYKVQSIADIIGHLSAVNNATSEEPRYPGFLEALEALQKSNGDAKMLTTKYSVSDMYHMRYEQTAELPDNFVVCGDAFIKLNPTFGQGCSKAAMDAVALDSVLRAKYLDDTRRVPKRTGPEAIQKMSALGRPMFDVNRWLDYMHPTTIPAPGETLVTGAWFRAYFKAVVRLTHKDPQAGALLWKVLGQVEPSAMLMQPRFFLKVMCNALAG